MESYRLPLGLGLGQLCLCVRQSRLGFFQFGFQRLDFCFQRLDLLLSGSGFGLGRSLLAKKRVHRVNTVIAGKARE